MPKGQMKVRLASRRDITKGFAIFAFAPEVEVSFLPGQYVALGIREQRRLIQRDYSIVSSPYQKFLEFFIELVDDGHLTRRLFHLQPGAEILVRPPRGRFLLDRASGRSHHLMIATVTGVAPFVSMLRTLTIEESRGEPPGIQVALLHGASHADEFGYDTELRNMAKRHSWLIYIPTVSRPGENPGWQGETVRVETLIEKTLDSLQWTALGTTAYLCGHPGMIEKGKKILAGRGFDKAQIREEEYWVEKK
ncbi:MAG: FAD-binding oxidoreductase [Candidatus Methylomirabilales bacterium]